MNKFLITNSDDFGMNDSITDAIIDSHKNGLMTSTTIMANMPGFDYAIRKAKENEALGVGIHFNLTEGIPIAQPRDIELLLDESGNFLNNKIQRNNFIYGKEVLKQARIELSLQLEKVLDNGLRPTHFDSHHHITGTPVAFRASVDACKKFGVNRARITNVDYRYLPNSNVSLGLKFKRQIKGLPKKTLHKRNFISLRKLGFKTPDTKILPYRIQPIHKDPVLHFVNVLSIIPNGITEISFHPGYENSNPNDRKSTKELRIRDLKVANSQLVMNAIKENGIELINFKDI